MRTSVFKSGDLCDKYRVVRLLATGGQGEVYLAQQEFIERDVALKTVRAPLADSKELHVRMKTEAKLLGKIQHPNVVTVFDAGITTTGVIFIAMELLDGQTLRDSLRAVGRVPIPQAFQVCATIAEGLEAAHEIGVVHRDVKPENVFITNQNATKILDLGTAKIIQAGLRTSRSDAVVGTLWYMAPEQILSNKVTVRSDVYALGLILFEMVGGSHAFASVEGPPPDKYQLGLRQLYSDPTPLPDVIKGFPSYVWDVIAKAIAKDPEQRFASMTEFAAAMRAARRRLVDDVRAQGMIPGNVDLRQRPPPPSTTEIPAIQSSSVDPVPPRVEPAPAAPFGVGPRNTIRISPAEVIATADVEQTARDAVPALVDIAPSAPEPVVERTSPSLPAVHVTPNVMSPATGVSVSSVPIFDRERQARDAKAGLEVLKALPDADQVRLALYELGQFPNAERFAIDVALATIPRARGAFALALSSALIDLAGSEAVPKASALAFIREAVSGYAPEALPMLEPFPTFEHRQAADPAPEAAPPTSSHTSVSEVSPSAAEAALAQVTPPPVITPVPVKPAASSDSRRITRAHGIAIGAGLGVVLGAVGILAIWTVRARSKSDTSSAAAASGVAEVSPAPTSTPSTPAVESSVRSGPTAGASSEPVVRTAPVASGRPSTSSTASLMPTARSEPARAPAAPKVPAGMPGSGL